MFHQIVNEDGSEIEREIERTVLHAGYAATAHTVLRAVSFTLRTWDEAHDPVPYVSAVTVALSGVDVYREDRLMLWDVVHGAIRFVSIGAKLIESDILSEALGERAAATETTHAAAQVALLDAIVSSYVNAAREAAPGGAEWRGDRFKSSMGW